MKSLITFKADMSSLNAEIMCEISTIRHNMISKNLEINREITHLRCKRDMEIATLTAPAHFEEDYFAQYAEHIEKKEAIRREYSAKIKKVGDQLKELTDKYTAQIQEATARYQNRQQELYNEFAKWLISDAKELTELTAYRCEINKFD